MYNFAFYFKGEMALGDMKYNADKTVRVNLGPGQAVNVWIYQNRIKHIIDGHTFTYYVLSDEVVENLGRSAAGIQSFYAVNYDDLRIAQDIEAALLNSPAVHQRLRNRAGGFFDVAAPYHLRMCLTFSQAGVPRVATAFPSATIGQMNANRIPETILESIYSLMAQGLGLRTLRQARGH